MGFSGYLSMQLVTNSFKARTAQLRELAPFNWKLKEHIHGGLSYFGHRRKPENNALQR